MSLRLACSAVLAAMALPCAGGPLPTPQSLIDDAPNVARQAAVTSEELGKCAQLEKTQVAVEEEKALGGAVAVNWVQRGGGVAIDYDRKLPPNALRDPAAVRLPGGAINGAEQLLNEVGKLLASRSSRPGLAWTFGVLKSDAVNAVSAPGGYVLVTRGLLHKVTSEAALAGVLAHEIAHVTERHALKVYSRVKANQCKVAAGAGFAGNVEPGRSLKASVSSMISGSTFGFVDLNSASNLVALEKFTDGLVDDLTSAGLAKDDELEADRIGLELILNSGYAPDAYLALVGGLAQGPQVFPHHPSGEERRHALEAWLRERSQEPANTFRSPTYPCPSCRNVPLEPALRID